MIYFRYDSIRRTPRIICHVFESDEASFIAQSIGQAFQVAYVEFLRANGIDDPSYLREIDYQVYFLFEYSGISIIIQNASALIVIFFQ